MLPSIAAAGILTAFAVMLGCLALVIPGLMLAFGLTLATPLIIERGVGPVDALRMSWSMTNGHKLTIFGILFCLGLLTGVLTLPLRGLEELSYVMLEEGNSFAFAAINAPMVLFEAVPGALVIAAIYSRLRSNHAGFGDAPDLT